MMVYMDSSTETKAMELATSIDEPLVNRTIVVRLHVHTHTTHNTQQTTHNTPTRYQQSGFIQLNRGSERQKYRFIAIQC